jgi:hypothetical protein
MKYKNVWSIKEVNLKNQNYFLVKVQIYVGHFAAKKHAKIRVKWSFKGWANVYIFWVEKFVFSPWNH